ncbi:MAG: methylated-DNA--[protein]-cysteine S-methyltransferase [Thermoguttaceae bacterium]
MRLITPLAPIILVEQDEKLIGLQWSLEMGNAEAKSGSSLDKSHFLIHVARRINEYFAGIRQEFDVPIRLRGTDFQHRVWDALQTIPFGETRSYKEIAVQIGNVKAVRAVGMANHCNPIPIIVPCHRVIAANGTLCGYAAGLETKQRLLDHERSHLK